METSPKKIGILIFSSRAMFREGLQLLLEAEPGLSVVGNTDDADEAVRLAVRLEPDVLLFEVNHLHLYSEGPDWQFLKQLIAKAPSVRPILLTTTNNERQIVEAIKLGVRGVARKSTDAALLFKCIYSVMEGKYWIGHSTICELLKSFESLNTMLEHRSKLLDCRLSEREFQVIREIASGSSNRDIAQTLSISEQAVKYHLTKIFDKTGMSSRMQLARFVIRNQLVRDA